MDTRYVYLSPPQDGGEIELPGDIYQDEFGVRRRAAINEDGRLLYYDFTGEPPLARAETVADIARYPWPDPHDPARYEGLGERVRQVVETTGKAVIVNAIASIFELSWYLRGYAQFYMDLIVIRRSSKRY